MLIYLLHLTEHNVNMWKKACLTAMHSVQIVEINVTYPVMYDTDNCFAFLAHLQP